VAKYAPPPEKGRPKGWCHPPRWCKACAAQQARLAEGGEATFMRPCLYIPSVLLHAEQTGWDENAFNAHGYPTRASPPFLAVARRDPLYKTER
jgi:hypothetical protein